MKVNKIFHILLLSGPITFLFERLKIWMDYVLHCYGAAQAIMT